MNNVVVSGLKRFTFEEVLKVAIDRYYVINEMNTDVNSLTSIEHIQLKDTIISINRDDIYISRASIFCRIISLRQFNQNLMTYLINILNKNIVPVLRSENDLVDFIEGKGKCYDFHGEIIETEAAFSIANINKLELKIIEKEELLSYPFLTIGISCLIASGTLNLLSVVDCIAAISCEAYGSHNDYYESSNFEINRPHRGQMLSASNLRVLLEGSKRINTCSNELKAKALSLHIAPQTTGPCRDIVISAAKVIEIELNCCETNSSRISNGMKFDDLQTHLSVRNICSAIEGLVSSTVARHQAIASLSIADSTCNSNLEDIDISSNSDTIIDLYAKIDRLSKFISRELFLSLETLNTIETNAAALKLSTATIEDVNTNTDGIEKELNHSMKTLKGDTDDSNLTPEQKARAEAKRKAKADKAAQKAIEKAQKKAVNAGISTVLGTGSTQIRNFIHQYQKKYNNDSTLKLSTIESLLVPLSTHEDSFFNYCTKLLEQLHSGGKYKPKIAKGARDFGPEQMRIREQAFSAIRRVFKRHGGVEIDTPVFELKELLTGKYGEDSKLIYDLADQGGELLSLRYDLTVPFARFLAMNSVGNIKRFHIAKVYRRDQPQPQRGRYREFYQCDFDIAGNYSPMVADAEVITVATEILTDLPVGKFCIKLNHRKLLDAIFEICGVPSEKFRPICSAVDKLDKMSWEDVKLEMIDEKGLSEVVANRIGEFVLHNGEPKELLSMLEEKNLFNDHIAANSALQELHLLFDYLDAMGSLQYISFDLSLARGLDYYTGVIYEAILTDGTVSVGSIAAGGRYDNLVGMFSTSGTQTPCVGVSIGIERVFAIMEKKADELKILQTTGIQVFIASIGPNLMTERMKIAQILWKQNISSEYTHHENPKFKRQLDEVLERQIPFMVVFGQDEIDKGIIKLKNMNKHTEIDLNRNDLISSLFEQGCITTTNNAYEMQFLEMLKH